MLDWDKIGFVICKPDAVYLGLEQDIWRFLRERGFRLLAYKYVAITHELCKELYEDRYQDFPEHWELEAEFFGLGESLCLVLYREEQKGYSSISQYINDKWKGSFIPEEAKSETIRGKFGSLNPVFDLVHSSDCTEAAKREVQLFFSLEDLSEVRDVNLETKATEWGQLDIAELYFWIKRKVIIATPMKGSVKRAYLNFVEKQYVRCKKVNRRMVRQLLFRMLKEEYKMFSSVIKTNMLLESITNYYYFRKINYEQVFRHPVLIELQLTKWEKCLLKTTLYDITL